MLGQFKNDCAVFVRLLVNIHEDVIVSIKLVPNFSSSMISNAIENRGCNCQGTTVFSFF